MIEAPLFRIGPARTEILVAPDATGFARSRAMACSDGIAPALMALISREMAKAEFVHESLPGLGNRETEESLRVSALLCFALQRGPFLRWMEQATGCETLVEVRGHVAQLRVDEDHRLDWHDDLGEAQRRLAVTINLGTEPYEGGQFELREKATRAPVMAHRHVQPGTVLIFDVAPDLEHRLLPVRSGGPRRVFAGWFYKAAAT